MPRYTERFAGDRPHLNEKHPDLLSARDRMLQRAELWTSHGWSPDIRATSVVLSRPYRASLLLEVND